MLNRAIGHIVNRLSRKPIGFYDLKIRENNPKNEKSNRYLRLIGRSTQEIRHYLDALKNAEILDGYLGDSRLATWGLTTNVMVNEPNTGKKNEPCVKIGICGLTFIFFPPVEQAFQDLVEKLEDYKSTPRIAYETGLVIHSFTRKECIILPNDINDVMLEYPWKREHKSQMSIFDELHHIRLRSRIRLLKSPVL